MKKFMAFLLTAAMTVSVFGVNVLAEEVTAEEAAALEEVVEAAEETVEALEEAEAALDEIDAALEEEVELTEEELAALEEFYKEVEKVVEETEGLEEVLEELYPAEEAVEEPAVEEVVEEIAEEPVVEEEVVEEEVCDVPEEAKAELSNAGVAVNGEAIAPQAYTIDGYTYFKLRDVAKALAGTVAGFDVSWDQAARMTALQTGTVYKYQDGDTDAAEYAKKATAFHSHDPIMVNGEEVALTAYNIDGYNYFKLRDLGAALGFEVTWDKAAKMIGINSEVVEVEAVEAEDVVEYTLEAGKPYVFENETFVKEVVLICPVVDEVKTEYNGDFALYEVSFTNCVFEKGLKVVSDKDTNVVIGEGCVFGEGTGVVVEEATEGNHLGMDLYDDPFVRIRAYVEGVTVTTDDTVVVFGTNVSVTLNGVTYTNDDFENPDGPYVDGFCVAQYFENGEAALYKEGWGLTYEEIEAMEAEAAAEEEAEEEEVAEEEAEEVVEEEVVAEEEPVEEA